MNCAACKHEYELEAHEENYKKEDDFIYLYLSNEVKTQSSRDSFRSEPREHQMYACPKCGTIKIQVWQ